MPHLPVSDFIYPVADVLLTGESNLKVLSSNPGFSK